jgi:ABC-2 type transport system permease protein
LRDAATMFRRNLRRQLRYPSVTVMLVAMPVVLLLLFVVVFGGTLGAGLEAGLGGGGSGAGAGATGGRSEYLAYVAPGVLLLALAAVAQGTSISVASDMTEGIIARFRTMAISRGAVLTGHVGGAMVQSMAGLVLVVLVAMAMGLRPTAGPLEWLAAFGALTLIAFALTWLAVALGVVARTVESASNLPMFLFLLPFLGSGFVPTESMPAGARWVAENQPFTPFVETVRGLLMGSPIGTSGWLTVAWCAVIAGGGYLWARSQYDRRSVRT